MGGEKGEMEREREIWPLAHVVKERERRSEREKARGR